jgi:hypothetical protein
MSFGGSPPPPPPPPPPPTDSPADIAARDAKAEADRQKRMAGGKASTILTSPLGDTGDAPVARKVLLGA